MRRLVILLVVGILLASTGRAQEKPKAPAESKPVTPLKVQVVISEYEGDHKIASLPYNFFVSANENPRGSVRMGLRVPVQVGGKDPSNPQFQYMDVGTNIDCLARSVEGGRVKLDLTVERSSLYTASGKKSLDWTPGDPSLGAQPIVRQTKMTSNFPIRDGETVQAAMSTDPVSGRVLKVDVTVNIVK